MMPEQDWNARYDILNAESIIVSPYRECLCTTADTVGRWGRSRPAGALESGMTEDELKPLVDAWRSPIKHRPALVDVDKATKEAVKERITTNTHGIGFRVRVDSVHHPAFWQTASYEARIGIGIRSTCVTYEGVGATKSGNVSILGPKLVENCLPMDWFSEQGSFPSRKFKHTTGSGTEWNG